MELTIRDKQLLCSLKFKPAKNAGFLQKQAAEDVNNLQKEAALDLLAVFEKGGEGITRKNAIEYEKIAGVNHHIELPLLRTNTFHRLAALFSLLRSFLSHINSCTEKLGHAFFSRALSIGGLSYGVELLFDLGVLFYKIVNPGPSDSDLSYYQRFKKLLHQGNRLDRIITSALAFTINCSCFFLTGGWSALFNLAGLLYDFAHIAYDSWLETSPCQNLLHTIESERNKSINKLNELEHSENNSQNESLKNNIKRDINALNFIESKVEHKVEKAQSHLLRNLAIGALIFASVTLSIFPPTSSIGIGLGIAAASFIVQDIIQGVGKKLRTLYSDHKKNAKLKQKAENEVNANDTTEKKPISSYALHCPELLKKEELSNESKKVEKKVDFVKQKPLVSLFNFDWMHPQQKVHAQPVPVKSSKPGYALSH